MKHILTVALGLLACTFSANAQTCFDGCQLGATANFTWNGSTDGYGPIVELATIDGNQPNATIGYAGDIQIMGYANGPQSLTELFLPNPGTCSLPRNPDGSCSGETFPDFPNNGKLACGAIAWGAKQWGTRADGTPMDGTKAGDSYSMTGTTSCTEWNGTVSVSLTEFRQMVQHQNCGRFGCGKPFLVDTETGGNGTATVTQ